MRPPLSPVHVLTVVVSLAIAAGPASAQRDHYNEYDFEIHPDAGAPPFSLTDQWGTTDHSFAVYDRFLAPTGQDEDPIGDPNAFLTRYFIGTGSEPRRIVDVSNKFGVNQQWNLRESFALLNPSLKNAPGGDPPNLNHYKCYLADGPFIGQTVVLTDQYNSYTVTVTEPAVWCNPAEKRHADGQTFPIVDPFAWLGCYFTTPASFFDPSIPVMISDQFGTANMQLVNRELLCVPSQKAVPVPEEAATWGEVKAVFR